MHVAVYRRILFVVLLSGIVAADEEPFSTGLASQHRGGLTITPYFTGEREIVSLNLSWTSPQALGSILVSGIVNDLTCKNDTYNVLYDETVKTVVIPKEDADLFKFGCSYNITIKGYNKTDSVEYTIPAYSHLIDQNATNPHHMMSWPLIDDNNVTHNSLDTNLTAQIHGDANQIKCNTTYLSIQPTYNKDIGVQLNVSWSKLAEDTSDLYTITVKSLNTTNCTRGNFHYQTAHTEKQATHTVLLPNYRSEHEEIMPSFSYLVEVTGTSYKEDAVCTLPDHVGNVVNCCDFPNATIDEIQQKSDYTFEVFWTNKTTIDTLTFSYKISNMSNIEEECIKDVDNLASPISIKCDNLEPEKKYYLYATLSYFNCKTTTNPVIFEVSASPTGEPVKWIVEVLALLALVVVALIVIISCKRKDLVKKLKPNAQFGNNNIEMYDTNNVISRGQEVYNVIYCESEILEGKTDKYEIPRSRIRILKQLDSGAFGQVFSGKILTPPNQRPLPNVAVKTLRDHAPIEEVEDFLSEISMLKKVGEHPNIVKLVGCCTLKQPYMMIMELIPCGSLRNYLLELRKKWEKNGSENDSVFLDSSDGAYISPNGQHSPTSTVPSHRFPSQTETEYTNLDSDSPLMEHCDHNVEPVLDNKELQNFALQIANGMAFLEEKHITHRDLAARNVLISEFKTLKISDFGLSRMGPYINGKTKKLPLRWMALESIEDNFYNNKTDVWSYGVVLWEIGSLGATPYENTANCLILHDLLQGKRLQRPGICTDELYKLMLRCWEFDPDARPSFRELVDLLGEKTKQMYVDFSQLNPTYVFPPAALAEM